jgi:hypothetical protein
MGIPRTNSAPQSKGERLVNINYSSGLTRAAELRFKARLLSECLGERFRLSGQPSVRDYLTLTLSLVTRFLDFRGLIHFPFRLLQPLPRSFAGVIVRAFTASHSSGRSDGP